jgi:hypothetical protein
MPDIVHSIVKSEKVYRFDIGKLTVERKEQSRIYWIFLMFSLPVPCIKSVVPNSYRRYYGYLLFAYGSRINVFWNIFPCRIRIFTAEWCDRIRPLESDKTCVVLTGNLVSGSVTLSTGMVTCKFMSKNIIRSCLTSVLQRPRGPSLCWCCCPRCRRRSSVVGRGCACSFSRHVLGWSA